MKYSNLLFSGPEDVKATLVKSIQKRRIENGIPVKDLDKVCGIGNFSIDGDLAMPSTEEIESDPSKLNGFIFGLVASPLNLRFDTELDLEVKVARLSNSQREAAMADMTKEGFRISAGAGGGDVSEIDSEKQFLAYIAYQVFQEIDSAN